VGVNVAVSVCAPTASTVPAAGEYTNVPATLAVALSCALPSAVPYVIAAGVAHVIVGTVFVFAANVPPHVRGPVSAMV